MNHPISIAMETTCRSGGVALGAGDRLVEAFEFDASARHATWLVARLDELLRRAALRPTDIEEVYVSAGPGSFTGIRVGVTVARTLAQAVDGLRCAAVPTVRAIAENARPLDWENLAVVLDAKEDRVYVQMFTRDGERIVPVGGGGVTTEAEFLQTVPRPVTLVGEGLGYHELAGERITIPSIDPEGNFPSVEAVWRIGRRMAGRGEFTEYHHLLPLYSRRPEALRLWEKRHDGE